MLLSTGTAFVHEKQEPRNRENEALKKQSPRRQNWCPQQLWTARQQMKKHADNPMLGLKLSGKASTKNFSPVKPTNPERNISLIWTEMQIAATHYNVNAHGYHLLMHRMRHARNQKKPGILSNRHKKAIDFSAASQRSSNNTSHTVVNKRFQSRT